MSRWDHTMPLTADSRQRLIDSRGNIISIVPLRSHSSRRETVSTDTNQKSIKKTTTVLTSRQDGQRVVNKNTRTTTTVTKTQGAVITEFPRRKSGQCLKHMITHTTDVLAREGVKMRPYYKSISIPTISQGSEEHKSDKQKQTQELEKIVQKRLVGNLTQKFEPQQRLQGNSYKETSNRGRNRVHKYQKENPENNLLSDTNYKDIRKTHQMNTAVKADQGNIDCVDLCTYPSTELQSSADSIASSCMPSTGSDCTSYAKMPSTSRTITDTETESDSKYQGSSSQAYTKSFTFSIPRSSLYKVSSKELKSILDASGELSSGSLPSTITKKFFMKKESPPDSTRLQGPSNNNTSKAPLGFTPNTDEKSFLFASGSPRLESGASTDRRGLDYSKIWTSVVRDIEIKSRRKINRYKDYVQD